MNNRPCQIRVAMLVDTTFKTLAMIRGDDHSRVLQSATAFDIVEKRAKRTIGSQQKLVIGKSTPINLLLHFRIIVWPPPVLRVFDEGLRFAWGYEET